MTTDWTVRPIHEHSAAWPHDDTHHVVAAFVLLLLERGAMTIDELSTRLDQARVVLGRIELGALSRLVDELEGERLVVHEEAADSEPARYALTPAGRAMILDWVPIMRDRRRVARTFLALYDRTDEQVPPPGP